MLLNLKGKRKERVRRHSFCAGRAETVILSQLRVHGSESLHIMVTWACMLTDIVEIATRDNYASSLLCKARECAEIYLLVTKRKKGCDGMGELAMIKEEFKEAVDDLINHCKGNDHLANDIQYDLDTIADILIAKQ